MTNDYPECYNLPTPVHKPRFTLRQIEDKKIRQKAALRSRLYYNSTGKYPPPELRQQWCEKLRNGEKIF